MASIELVNEPSPCCWLDHAVDDPVLDSQLVWHHVVIVVIICYLGRFANTIDTGDTYFTVRLINRDLLVVLWKRKWLRRFLHMQLVDTLNREDLSLVEVNGCLLGLRNRDLLGSVYLVVVHVTHAI